MIISKYECKGIGRALVLFNFVTSLLQFIYDIQLNIDLADFGRDKNFS